MSQRERILMILGVGVAGAFIGPLGFILLGMMRTEGGLARTLRLDTLGRLVTGVFSFGPLAAFAACAMIGTLLFAPMFVSRIDRLHAQARSPRSYYWRAAGAGMVLGMAATVVTTLLLLLAALMVGDWTPSVPDQSPVVLIGGTVFFGVLVGSSMAVISLPVIVPIGGLLGATAGWFRRRAGSA